MWFDATFGFGTYLMEDVNQGIRDAKAEDAGLDWDEIGPKLGATTVTSIAVMPRSTRTLSAASGIGLSSLQPEPIHLRTTDQLLQRHS